MAQPRGPRGLVSREHERLQGLSASQHHWPGALRRLRALGVLCGQDIAGISVPGRTPLQGPRPALLCWVCGGLRTGGTGVRETLGLRGGAAGASCGDSGGCCGHRTWQLRARPDSQAILMAPPLDVPEWGVSVHPSFYPNATSPAEPTAPGTFPGGLQVWVPRQQAHSVAEQGTLG